MCINKECIFTQKKKQGKLQLSLAKPDKDKYDACDNKQHNLQQ